MEALIIGHSFIRRLQAEHFPTHAANITTRPNARLLAKSLDLTDYYSGIYTVCHKVNTVKSLSSVIAEIKNIVAKVNINIILLDLGSNDLAQLANVSPRLCLKLAEIITDFALTLRKKFCKGVIIHSVVPRTRRLAASPPVFTSNLKLYNNFVKQFLATEQTEKFVKLKGFYPSGCPALHTSVAEWSGDGIHCTTKEGRHRYTARVRHSLLYHHHLG